MADKTPLQENLSPPQDRELTKLVSIAQCDSRLPLTRTAELESKAESDCKEIESIGVDRYGRSRAGSRVDEILPIPTLVRSR